MNEWYCRMTRFLVSPNLILDKQVPIRIIWLHRLYDPCVDYRRSICYVSGAFLGTVAIQYDLPFTK